MPLFEYYCESCAKEFTVLQSANVNKEETVCPECSQKARYKFSTFTSKIKSSGKSLNTPVTADELPNKNVLNLPLPRLRSEL